MRLTWGILAICAACTGSENAAEMGACGAADLQYMVGQSADVLATMRFRTPMRVVGPDTAVTMDYNPERINIAVDDRGYITAVTCG